LIALSVFIIFVYSVEHGKLALIALPFGNTIISGCILFLIASYVTPSNKLVFRILNNKLIVHIGILSYSIYIWQEFFFVGEIGGVWRTFPYNIIVIYLVE